MLSAQKSYSEAVRWLKASRPRRAAPVTFALRSFAAALLAGLLVLGVIGLLSPASFGAPTSRAFSSGVWTFALAALVSLCLLIAVTRLGYYRGLSVRIREPFTRSYGGDQNFEGAADNLAQCPAALHTRWALAWIWFPALLAMGGVTFAFSCAFFAVGAIVSGGDVGWGNGLLAGSNAALSFLCFALATARLSTWRLAIGVYREVTGR